MINPKPASRFPLSKTNNLSKLTTKKHVTAVIDEKIKKIFYSLLIYCIIFSVISCRKAGSGGSATSSGDAAPTNVVFG